MNDLIFSAAMTMFLAGIACALMTTVAFLTWGIFKYQRDVISKLNKQEELPKEELLIYGEHQFYLKLLRYSPIAIGISFFLFILAFIF